MISYTPIPNWKELASFAIGPQLPDSQLADPWQKDKETAYWFSRAAWALEAISLYLNFLNGKKLPIIWLPDYFCNGSLWPIRSTKAKILFYPVGIDLEPKWDRCQEMAVANPPDLFVLVHYFGAPAKAKDAFDFCQTHNALLVEDAAHAVGPAPGIGEFGDFILYSPYKILPVPDGGLLLVRNKNTANLLAEIHADLCRTQPTTATWLLKKLIQKMVPLLASSLTKNRHKLDFNIDPPYAPLQRLTDLSRPARQMLNKSSQTLGQITARRIKNAEALKNALKLQEQFSFWPNNEKINPAPPYRFALKFEDPEVAQRCFSKLNLAGIPAESWPDLPPEIYGNVNLHEDAIKMRQTVVFLPVHQTLEIDKYCSICASLLPF
jgi:hypothetical protein